MTDTRAIRGDVLALDLATTMGWAEGGPGTNAPRSGSVRLAPPGSEPMAIFGGALKWLGLRLQAFRPQTIIYEAPFAPSVMKGKTTVNTARILLGLPAVIEAVAYSMGVYDIREADVGDVRQHFIGTRRLKSEQAKRRVMERCRMIGHQPKDDNEGDALALWYYATAILDPRTAARSTPLLGRVGHG